MFLLSSPEPGTMPHKDSCLALVKKKIIVITSFGFFSLNNNFHVISYFPCLPHFSVCIQEDYDFTSLIRPFLIFTVFDITFHEIICKGISNKGKRYGTYKCNKNEQGKISKGFKEEMALV